VSRSARAALGTAGEALVADHLRRQGFTIVGENVRVGRLELDLVAVRDGLLVFCEVRTRTSADFVDPIETIDGPKRARIRRAAAGWLAAGGAPPHTEVRFDAASVLIAPHAAPTLTYYEDAF